MKKMIQVFILLMFFIVLNSTATALGISNANFGDVEQGKSYNITITLVNSQNDFDNHFIVEISGALKNWISISPSEFDLAKGNSKQINLTLKVPSDTVLGQSTGTVTATGKKTAPSGGADSGGANVGYAVATKGNIYANVVKPGAVASVEITNVEVQSNVASGSVAKLTVFSKNSGNVATSASFKLDIKKDSKIVASIPGTPTDFAIGEGKTVKLFWDTQGVEDGRYEAYIEAATIAKGSEKTSSATYRPVPVTVGKEKDFNSLLLASAGAVILIVIIAVVLKRRK